MSKPDVCHVCGGNPCYAICPMVDPYAGDPRREHEDHEAGAQYDDVSERYGLGVRDDHDGWDTWQTEAACDRENPNAGIEAIEAQEKDSTAPTGWEDADDLPADEDSIPF